MEKFPRTAILAGGVGGSRLVSGFYKYFYKESSPDDYKDPNRLPLAVFINTGDDFFWESLYVCPDLDTNMYSAAGINDELHGWGIKDDSQKALNMLKHWPGDTWFGMGDLDIGVNLRRTAWLSQGRKLSEITSDLCRGLGAVPCLFPMSDDRVSTYVHTDSGTFSFQEYFVKRRCQDKPLGFEYKGLSDASPQQHLLKKIKEAELIVLAPSNPFTSLIPILELKGVKNALKNSRAKKIAVSPMIGQKTFKGPLAEMLKYAGQEVSAFGCLQYFREFIDYAVISYEDAAIADKFKNLGIEPKFCSISLKTECERAQMCRFIINI